MYVQSRLSECLVQILYSGQTECAHRSGPEVIKLFSCSTQLSMKFHLVIKIKNTNNKTFFKLNSAEHAQLS